MGRMKRVLRMKVWLVGVAGRSVGGLGFEGSCLLGFYLCIWSERGFCSAF